MDYSLPGSSVHGILQARRVEWVAMPSSRESSQPSDRTHISCVSCITGGFFTAETPGKPTPSNSTSMLLPQAYVYHIKNQDRKAVLIIYIVEFLLQASYLAEAALYITHLILSLQETLRPPEADPSFGIPWWEEIKFKMSYES